MPECRRCGLHQASIHSKIADASCSVVSQVRVSSSSRCIVDQNDSIVVLSTDQATRPIDPSSPCSEEVLAEYPRGVLTSAIGVHDRPGVGVTPPERHL